jgi:hypothetical protein
LVVDLSAKTCEELHRLASFADALARELEAAGQPADAVEHFHDLIVQELRWPSSRAP